MKLIFVVESDSKSRSDYKYIKHIFDLKYGSGREVGCQLTPIYAKSKSLLTKQDKKIKAEIKNYEEKSHVVIVSDYDRDGDHLNSLIEEYCKKEKYDLVWMNGCIEEVFGTASKGNKGKIADEFIKKTSAIEKDLSDRLSVEDPKRIAKSSNLFIILEKYLKK